MHVASPLGLHGKKHNHRTPKRAFRGSVSFSTYLRVLIVRPSYYQQTERLSLNNCSYPISHRFLKLHSYFKSESQAAPTNTKSVSRRFHTSFSSHFIHDIKKILPSSGSHVPSLPSLSPLPPQPAPPHYLHLCPPVRQQTSHTAALYHSRISSAAYSMERLYSRVL